jgi:hypothetical protein
MIYEHVFVPHLFFNQGLCDYNANWKMGVLIKRLMIAYSMLGPTVSAVLDGSVHGVVVHAKK